MFTRNKYYYKIVYLSICLLIVLGFTYGYLYTVSKTKTNQIASEIGSYEGIKNIEDQLTEDNTQNTENQNFISNDAILTAVSYYKECDHTITQNSKVTEDVASLTEMQFKIEYSDWSVEKFDTNQIIISRQFEGKCPEHYILKEKNGKVAVYYQNPINGVSLKELTNIPLSNLAKVDQEKLKEGIYVESNTSLAEILEDFGS